VTTQPLSAVTRMIGGGTPRREEPSYWGGDIPWVSPKDMGPRLISESQQTLTQSGLQNSASRLAPAGSVLVVARSGVLAHKVPLGVTARAVALNQDIKALIPTAGLSPDYLYWFLRSRERYLLSAGVKRGATVQSLRTEVLQNLTIPVPPIEDQLVLSSRLNRASAISEKRKLAQQALHALRLAVFQQRVGASAVVRRPLGEVTRIVRGASPRPKGDPRYFGGTIPWIKIGDLDRNSDYLTKTSEGVTPEGAARSVLIEPGTVLLSNSASVGTAVISGIEGCIHDGWVAFLDLADELDRDYLYLALRAARRDLVALAPTGTQANLNTTIVKHFEIPVPPISEQRRTVAKDRQVRELVDAGLRQARALRDLQQSLLVRSFPQ
jgi:type I restriction enzyme S subunit